MATLPVELAFRGSIDKIAENTEGLYKGSLEHYVAAVFNDANNVDHPYHNFCHMGFMLWRCHDACRFYQKVLSRVQMRNVLIAAVMHDYDHTGTAGPDSRNIRRAHVGLGTCILPEDLDSYDDITGIIDASEYPYRVDSPPSHELPLTSQIIRDADLTQVFSSTWIQQVPFGLAKEWGKRPIEVLRMQIPFLQNLRFVTEWARTLFPPSVIDEKIGEVRGLLRVVDREAKTSR